MPAEVDESVGRAMEASAEAAADLRTTDNKSSMTASTTSELVPGLITGVDESLPRFICVGAGIDEMEVAYLDLPSGDPGSIEPPLVLVHGFTGHRDDFIGVAAVLAGRRRVLIPDLRGHGDSSSRPGSLGWSFEQLVMDLGGFLDALDVERCDLLGHSLGGMVALRCALAFPERLRSLVLMCTTPEAPESLSLELLLKAADIAEALGMPKLQELAEKGGRGSPSDSIRGWGERYWSHHRRRLLAMTPTSYRGVGKELFEAASQVERLGEITLPTLILVGEHDTDFMPGANLFEEYLPNARRLTIEGAEHHPHQENSAAFLNAMTAHLARLA